MSSLASRRSRPLRGRTYSGERRGVLNNFFSDCSFITSQSHLHIATSAAHPNRHCSALPRSHRITSITDPLGRITRKFYDSQGNLTKVIDPAGRVSETAYATFNGIVKPVAMTRSKDVGVQSSSMTYENVRANLLSATNPIGQTTSFAVSGHLTASCIDAENVNGGAILARQFYAGGSAMFQGNSAS